ncbi:glycine zipper 2TM domain-containing protein [uncultured Thiocystis sp.]|uniref:glycine zipper 2TM domain-containing protein n=1 Tax=uncultured Thiocystis sp. TaxID=1202134 RepID=UPI0025F0448B|nr:glycine zipper 2TM domain-containing protein [uncultured Thiocystis sp.]
MNKKQKYQGGLVTLAVLIGLGGCGGMSRQEQNTLAGAGLGGVAGSLLTDGSAIGTIGGAAVGGVIGHEVGNDRRDDRYRNDGRDDRDNRYSRGRRQDVSDRSDRSHRSVGYGDGDWFGY